MILADYHHHIVGRDSTVRQTSQESILRLLYFEIDDGSGLTVCFDASIDAVILVLLPWESWSLVYEERVLFNVSTFGSSTMYAQ